MGAPFLGQCIQRGGGGPLDIFRGGKKKTKEGWERFLRGSANGKKQFRHRFFFPIFFRPPKLTLEMRERKIYMYRRLEKLQSKDPRPKKNVIRSRGERRRIVELSQEVSTRSAFEGFEEAASLPVASCHLVYHGLAGHHLRVPLHVIGSQRVIGRAGKIAPVAA